MSMSDFKKYLQNENIDGDVVSALEDRAAFLEREMNRAQESDSYTEEWKKTYSYDLQNRIKKLRSVAQWLGT